MGLVLVVLVVILVAGVLTGIRSRRRQAVFAERIVRSLSSNQSRAGFAFGRISDAKTDREKAIAAAMNRALDTVSQQITRLSEERDVLRHILQTMTTGVIYVNSTGRIEMMNQAAEKMFLKPALQVQDSEHWAVIHNYELGAAIDNALLFGRSWSSEMSLRPGATANVQVIPIPVEPHGTVGARQVHTALLLCNDVSQWRRLEQMRSDFVANVSHELKTPITAIQGFAETLLDSEHDAETEKEFLQVIHDESVRMKNLVSDLLTLTRLENGSSTDAFHEVNLADVVAESVQVIERMATAAGIQIDNQLQEGSITVWGHDEQLKQVLLNLLTNAIHYTPTGGVITVFAESYVDRVKVHVSDTGIGIPKEDQDRVFERFYRVDRDRSRATGGTGLGLAIVKHIVQTHGGELGVDSQLGMGSDFWFTISRLRGLHADL